MSAVSRGERAEGSSIFRTSEIVKLVSVLRSGAAMAEGGTSNDRVQIAGNSRLGTPSTLRPLNKKRARASGFARFHFHSPDVTFNKRHVDSFERRRRSSGTEKTAERFPLCVFVLVSLTARTSRWRVALTSAAFHYYVPSIRNGREQQSVIKS